MNGFVIALAADAARPRRSLATTRHDGLVVAARGFVANASELAAGSGPAHDLNALFARAYRRWGEQLQQHVLGEYVAAIYDERARRLVFTHDALGLIAGFFAASGGSIVAGCDLDDVVAVAGAHAIDEEYVADHFVLGVPCAGRTPYRGVRRLEPGTTIVWDAGALRSARTWDLARVRPLRLRDDAAYEERLRELLADAVRTAIEPQLTTWCELSGGLDSSSVISVAAASCGRPLPALSMIYGTSKHGDERRWMRAVVERYGLPWHRIDVDAFPPFSEVPQVRFAEPNIAMPVWALYREYGRLLERHGAGVLLTGIGGDHIFAGDMPEPNHLGDALLGLDPFAFVSSLRAWQRHSPLRRSLLHFTAANVIRPLVRHGLGRHAMDDGSANFSLPPWIDAGFARAMRLERRLWRRQATRCRTPGDQQFWDGLYKLGSSAGTMRDAMPKPFTFRNPLLYRPLVEFLFAIPWQQRVRPDEDRSLQRRAMAGILPESVRARRGKRGAEQAYFEGLRAGGEWLEMLRDRPRIVERGYVDARGWREAVDRARYGRMHTMRHVIAAASLECWLRQPHPPSPPIPIEGETDERETALFHA